MRSRPELAKSLACALIGAVAVSVSCIAAAQTAPAGADAPVVSSSAERADAAESPRRSRERRRAQETAAPPPAATAATPAAETAATPPTTAEKPADELVCRSVKPAGTRLPQRVCYTQQQWDSLTEAAQEDMRRFRDRASASGARPN